MVYIDEASVQTVDILRYTAGTRSTTTTIHDDVVMDIQPIGGGASGVDGMHLGSQNLHYGFVRTPLTGVKQGDLVRRTGYTDLYIMRIDQSASVQEFLLSEQEQLVL